jgi:hypothetical protein
VRVDLETNVDDQYPKTELFDVTADSNSITDTTNRRRLGPTAAAETISALNSGTDPSSNGEITNNNGTLKIKTDGKVEELGQSKTQQRLLAAQTGSYY